jgi:hypothetical protein
MHLQVRVNSLTQHAQPAPALRAASPTRRAAVLRGQKRDVSLAVVVERARARLKEAHGGEVRALCNHATQPSEPMLPSEVPLCHVLVHVLLAAQATASVAQYALCHAKLP